MGSPHTSDVVIEELDKWSRLQRQIQEFTYFLFDSSTVAQLCSCVFHNVNNIRLLAILRGTEKEAVGANQHSKVSRQYLILLQFVCPPSEFW